MEGRNQWDIQKKDVGEKEREGKLKNVGIQNLKTEEKNARKKKTTDNWEESA